MADTGAAEIDDSEVNGCNVWKSALCRTHDRSTCPEKNYYPYSSIHCNMTGPTVSLQQASDSTISYVEALLEENDLPTRDVRSKLEWFYLGYDGDDPVGVGGVEVHGTEGLLRSVVVEQSARGEGFGTAICEALETRARNEGVETLYLLTTTAPAFFSDREFVEIERTEAPTAIRQTTEFDDLCPASAACMRKSL